MLTSIRKGFLFFCFCVCTALSSALAQSSSVSPYSRFGPGELLFNGFAHQRAMGGTAVAQANAARLNLANPATLRYDSLMVFEFGLLNESLDLQQNDLASRKVNSRLDYLVVGLPVLRNRIGMAFGFIPQTGSGYSIRSGTQLDSLNSYTTTYEGTGGYNRYFIASGFRITQNLSFGATASYIFGSTQQNRDILFSNSNYMGTRVRDNTVIKDFLFDFGLHWRSTFNETHTLSIGVSGSMERKLNANRTFLWENFRPNAFGTPVAKDTVIFREKERGLVTMPLFWALGVQVAKMDKWLLQSDLRFQQWSKYSSFDSNDSLKNSMRVAIGGQYVDDPKGTKFLQRIQFRAGLYHGRSFLNIRNTDITDNGITIGAGLPLRKAFQSMVNIAIEAGQRGTIDNDLIRERYFRVILGLTFNENWFQKKRYE